MLILSLLGFGPAYAQTPQSTSITLPDGTVCQNAGQGATITFEGQRVSYTCSNPDVVLLGTPTQQNGMLTITRGAMAGSTVASASQVTLLMSRVDLLDGSTCVFAGTGATVAINGQRLNYTCGDPSIGLLGDFNTSQPLWTADKVTLTQGSNGPTVQSRQTLGIRNVNTSNQTPAPAPAQATAIQLPDGTVCQFAGTGATAVFNGKRVDYTCGTRSDGGTTVILGQPTMDSGVWVVEVGIVDNVNNGASLRSSQTMRMQFTKVELVDNTVCDWAGNGATLSFDGQRMNYTCGRPEEGLLGDFDTSQPLWTTVKVVIEQQSGGAFAITQRQTLGITKVTGSTVTPQAQATSITLPDGTICQFAGTGATITFNGQRANYTCSNPAIVILGTPTFSDGAWHIVQGNVQVTNGSPTIVSSTTLDADFSKVALLDGSNCNFAGTGATIVIDGQRLNYTCGDPSVGLIGDFNTTQPLWTAEKVTVQQTANGFAAQSRSTVGIASVTAVAHSAAPAPPPAPAPAPGPVNAPPQTRDERYFPETDFRIGSDAFWDFFQTRGAIDTFGFPVSRQFGFLGCPVQIFQRAIMQQCGSTAPVGLLNLLDPELFPYTVVNGSTFPGPDEQVKAATPSVSSPNYNDAILQFVRDTAPDEWNGAPVMFEQTFFSTGGLEIWGAPISNPAYDPSNHDFIYQRYQRGIMHYTTGLGTRGVLLADYLKAIMLGPDLAKQRGANLPDDLKQEAKNSTLYSQYCPGTTAWLCRPGDMPGSDLTYAFEPR